YWLLIVFCSSTVNKMAVTVNFYKLSTSANNLNLNALVNGLNSIVEKRVCKL
ncbi:hypothetical protein KI387_001283, partial [Taxus chinensis]